MSTLDMKITPSRAMQSITVFVITVGNVILHVAQHPQAKLREAQYEYAVGMSRRFSPLPLFGMSAVRTGCGK